MKKFTWLILGLLVIVAFDANGQSRVWSSKDGSSNVEAYYIQASRGKVILEKTDGSRIVVPMSQLCEADQKYLASVIIPEIEVDVSSDVERDRSGGWDSDTVSDEISFEIVLTKKNKEPCSRSLKALFYAIGKDGQATGRKVLSKVEKKFSFEKKNRFLFNAKASAKMEKRRNWSEGFEYEGYIVIILDDKDRFIAASANKNIYESRVAALLKLNSGAEVNNDFR